MIEYLQSLSKKNSQLIFEFAPLIFDENADLGIEVLFCFCFK